MVVSDKPILSFIIVSNNYLDVNGEYKNCIRSGQPEGKSEIQIGCFELQDIKICGYDCETGYYDF